MNQQQDAKVTSDRELLELAARAAGLTGMRYDGPSGLHKMIDPRYPISTGTIGPAWNPLTDDGDALRLAVKLRLTVQVRDDHVKVGWSGCVQWIGEDCLPCDSAHMPAATRRAIVRAAAEIAKAGAA